VPGRDRGPGRSDRGRLRALARTGATPSRVVAGRAVARRSAHPPISCVHVLGTAPVDGDPGDASARPAWLAARLDAQLSAARRHRRAVERRVAGTVVNALVLGGS